MRKIAIICTFLLGLNSFALKGAAYAWNDKETHPLLTEYAAEESVLGKDKGDNLKKAFG